jgi:endo-1,4-beta-D-glucanase Y
MLDNYYNNIIILLTYLNDTMRFDVSMEETSNLIASFR